MDHLAPAVVRQTHFIGPSASWSALPLRTTQAERVEMMARQTHPPTAGPSVLAQAHHFNISSHQVNWLFRILSRKWSSTEAAESVGKAGPPLDPGLGPGDVAKVKGL